eukprot:7611590-Prorocentrum_lima.AAC.1
MNQGREGGTTISSERVPSEACELTAPKALRAPSQNTSFMHAMLDFILCEIRQVRQESLAK